MKSALAAGIASAALAAATLVVAAPAFAGGDSYGSYKDVGYAPPARAAAGPCYFRADVGYALANDPDVKWPVNTVTRTWSHDPGVGNHPTDPGYVGTQTGYHTTYIGNDVTNVSIDNTWFGEVGVGCGRGSRGIRVEAVLGFRGSQKIEGEPQPFEIIDDYPTQPDHDQDVEDPMHTSIRSTTLMVNAFYDLGRYGNFVPYVGAGLGVAYHRMDEVYFTENPFLTNRIEGNNDISLAWSLMAGVAYQVTDRAVLDFGYRYMDLGKIESGRADNAGYVNPAVKVDDLTSHEFKLGLRYHFGGGEAEPVAYAPMK